MGKVVKLAAREASLKRRLRRHLKKVGFTKNQVGELKISGTGKDAIRLRLNGTKLELRDSDGQVVGRLAKAFRSPTGMRCISAKVDSAFVRFAEDSDPRYRDRVRTDQWEVRLAGIHPSGVFAWIVNRIYNPCKDMEGSDVSSQPLEGAA